MALSLLVRKAEVWFSGSYWGFTKTLLRREPKNVAAEILRVGLREFELPPNGNLTMICAMTKGSQRTTTKSYLTHEQVKTIVPAIYQELVRNGVIPIEHRQVQPNNWLPLNGFGEPIPTFVEIYIQHSGKTITFQDPWVLVLFARYWGNSAHLPTKSRDIMRAVIYDGNHRVPVEVEVREIIERNPDLFSVLQPYWQPD